MFSMSIAFPDSIGGDAWVEFCKCTWLFRYAGWPLPVNIMYSSIKSKNIWISCYLLWWRIMYWYHGGCLSDVSTLLTLTSIPSCSRGRNDAVWSSSSFAQDEANCSTRTWAHKSLYPTDNYMTSLLDASLCSHWNKEIANLIIGLFICLCPYIIGPVLKINNNIMSIHYFEISF